MRYVPLVSLITSFRPCSISGNKAAKARNWSIPVVNHTWLEDCFIQWRNLSVGLEKYVAFPPGLDFSDHLGERGVQREVILDTLPDLIDEMTVERDEINSIGQGSIRRNGESSPQVAVKRSKARRVQGEGAMDRPESGHGMDADARSQPTGEQVVEDDHMQVDRPVVSCDSAANPERNRTGRSSGGTAEHTSPLRQPTHPPQRTHEGPSSAGNRRLRADPGTTEDAPSPTKRSAHDKSTVTGTPVMSPSKSRSTTPLRMESVLMPPKGTGKALRKSPQQSVIRTSPVKSNRKGGETRPESVSTELAPPLSSLAVDTTMDQEEGPARRTSRRSAANKASQRLRDEVMPDVVNFEKELRRGHMRAANLLKSERGEEKTDIAPKALMKGKKRASIQLTMEDVVSSDGEHERKKRRLSGTRTNDHFKGRDDDDRADITEASSQGSVEFLSNKGGTKVAKAKKPSSYRDSRQVEPVPHDSFFYLTGHSDKSVRILATQVTLDETEEKVWLKVHDS